MQIYSLLNLKISVHSNPVFYQLMSDGLMWWHKNILVLFVEDLYYLKYKKKNQKSEQEAQPNCKAVVKINTQLFFYTLGKSHICPLLSI